MHLREHRGSLEESLSTSIEIPNTFDALITTLRDRLQMPKLTLNRDTVHVEWYAFDPRISPQDVWIVTVKDYGVYGFLDSNVEV